ncbi:MAG: hypothetical protein ACOXZV_11460 [Bacteroidales bacterium]|jgi:hypothetical protein
MKKEYYSFSLYESNRFARIIQLIFGIICIAVAFIWLFMNLKTSGSSLDFWVTILFLIGFGSWQINYGLGFAGKFIEISKNYIRLKKSSILPVRQINAADISSVRVYPLNLIFLLKNGKKVKLRFGTTYTNDISRIKDSVLKFASVNNISAEVKTEEL